MSPRFRLALLLPACAMVSGLGVLILQRTAGTDQLASPSEATLGLALLWSLAVAVVSFAWAQRRQAAWDRSLAMLELQARHIAEGRFDLVPEGCVAEMQALARSMNAMSLRLRGVFEEEPRPNETLRRQAQPDPLTGLDNRAVFLHRLTEQLGHPAKPDGALLVARLASDDDAGLLPGDDRGARVLAALSDVLRNYPTRVPGAFVGRLAERDFGLYLPAHGLAAETATTLLAAWRAGPAGQLGNASCVVGAVDRLGGQPLSLALSTVEQALQEAEARGPFSMQVCSARETADSAELWSGRLGILRALDEGRVRLAEFPVLDAKHQVLHLECPLRLRRDPAGAWEAAEAWLGMAARHRLMAQVDMKAVQLTLRAIATDGVPRCAHVSSQSLSTAGFTSAVREMLEAEPEAARRLWIEIAEVSFENLPPRLRSACTAWRRSGVRLGIEHAGTGLRSLVGLQDLGLDYVKLASSHVNGVAEDGALRQRALGMVALVHSLGATVIAEGVEQAADVAELWSLGFDALTGPAITSLAAPATAQEMSPA